MHYAASNDFLNKRNMNRNLLGTILNSRTPEQLAHMRNTVGSGVCPFCDLNKALNKVTWTGAFWRRWHNPFPYPNHRKHIIIASLLHWNIDEIPGAAILEMWDIVSATRREENIAGCGLVFRIGDPDFNAGTLTHPHWHIQMPEPGKLAIAVFGKPPGMINVAPVFADQDSYVI